MSQIESIKQLGVSRTLTLVRFGYRLRHYINQNYSWLIDREVKNFIRVNVNTFCESDVTTFINWVKENPQEVELWLVSNAPACAAKLAVSNGKRLHPESEKIILEKGKDKIGIAVPTRSIPWRCTKFGIIIPDSSKVTLKAAFADNSWREKRYVKKIEETKKHMKGFLVQMIGLGQIRGDQTISEVLETL